MLPLCYLFDLCFVVGKPIDTPRDPNPSRELVDSIHQKYMTGLLHMFEQYKGAFGVEENVKLTFV